LIGLIDEPINKEDTVLFNIDIEEKKKKANKKLTYEKRIKNFEIGSKSLQ
jgi:hypothetical protein